MTTKLLEELKEKVQGQSKWMEAVDKIKDGIYIAGMLSKTNKSGKRIRGV